MQYIRNFFATYAVDLRGGSGCPELCWTLFSARRRALYFAKNQRKGNVVVRRVRDYQVIQTF